MTWDAYTHFCACFSSCGGSDLLFSLRYSASLFAMRLEIGHVTIMKVEWQRNQAFTEELATLWE